MKFNGMRTPTGCKVFAEGEELPLYLAEVNHSPTGFEWGYLGSGPAQLSYAILRYFMGSETDPALSQSLARKLYQEFKAQVIARISNDCSSFDMTVNFIRGDSVKLSRFEITVSVPTLFQTFSTNLIIDTRS